MKNPFARNIDEARLQSEAEVVDTRSAWERLDAGYRNLCKQMAGRLSPQNRRVRFAVDRLLASRKDYKPVRVTRQQTRNANR